MIRKLRAVLLAAAVVGIAGQLGCIWLVGAAIGIGIRSAVEGTRDPDDQWLLPDGGKPVRTPTKKPDPPSNDKPVPE